MTPDPTEARIRAAIAEATGVELLPDDPLAGHLAAIIEARGIGLDVLMLWIHDRPRHPWTARHLIHWAIAHFASCSGPLPPAA